MVLKTLVVSSKTVQVIKFFRRCPGFRIHGGVDSLYQVNYFTPALCCFEFTIRCVMRSLLSLSILFSLFLTGCGEPAPQPIEGHDSAEELTEAELEVEQELAESNEDDSDDDESDDDESDDE